jgi:methylated-DNA-[protein]-cysteine S-methyltransferase
MQVTGGALDLGGREQEDTMTATARQTYMESPIGRLRLQSDGTCLTEIAFVRRQRKAGRVQPDHLLRETVRQLEAYFAGRLRIFDLPLGPEGSPFQLAAWRTLRGIAYAQTITYAQQAARMGRPGAARAVGSANGRNPLPIVVPCHRVVGSDGTLTGYGGGLDVKRFLLRLEGAL